MSERILSTRAQPPDPQNEVAALTAIRNGDKTGKLTGSSEYRRYNTLSIAARFPIIARHVGFEVRA